MGVIHAQFRRTCNPYGVASPRKGTIFSAMDFTDGLRCGLPNGIVLERRRLYPDVGPWKICGFARSGASEIANWPGFPHAADMAYQYRTRQCLGNGYLGDPSTPYRMDFDGGANLISPALPNFPTPIAARPLAGGKFLVSWQYSGFGQGGPPADFQVFAGLNGAAVNYASPLTDSITGLNHVPAAGRRERFELTTAAYADGDSVVFGARARSSAGIAEKNTRVSAASIARVNTASATSILLAVQR